MDCCYHSVIGSTNFSFHYQPEKVECFPEHRNKSTNKNTLFGSFWRSGILGYDCFGSHQSICLKLVGCKPKLAVTGVGVNIPVGSTSPWCLRGQFFGSGFGGVVAAILSCGWNTNGKSFCSDTSRLLWSWHPCFFTHLVLCDRNMDFMLVLEYFEMVHLFFLQMSRQSLALDGKDSRA